MKPSDRGGLGATDFLRYGAHRIRSLRPRSTRREPLPDTIARWEYRGHQLELRGPRVSDYQEWRAVRLRNREQLEPVWTADDRPWADRHRPTDWLDEVRAARRGRRDRSSMINFIFLDGAMAGQINLEWIHEGTGTAEYGAWLDSSATRLHLMQTCHQQLARFAFDELGLERLSAPISVGNMSAGISVLRMGFVREGVMRAYLGTGSGRDDHTMFAMTRADHERWRREYSATADAAACPSTEGTRDFSASIRAQERLHDLVPGGAHTYARGEDQYPDGMAPVIARGRGSHVWDVDGNEFIEYGAGLRSVTLGHAYAPVVEAVRSVLDEGNNFSRPSALELAAAEDFLTCVPTAEMVKFAKNGSDATTAAVRLARAVTGRTTIAICDQPFFSVDDWFIGSTAMNAGTRDDHTVRFGYHDIDNLRNLLAGNDIAAVIMEAATALAEPAPGSLETIRDLCSAHGTLLIFDEMITGFRWSAAGAQSVYGVTPDLSCWGKALGNGFPIAALAGRRDVMEAGGLRAPAERVFLLSTTHGPESASLAAMRAVIAAYRTEDPIGRMERTGTSLADGINALAADHGIADRLQVVGRPSCLVFVTRDADGNPSQAYRTLAMQELIERGVLGQSLVVSAAHTERDVARTVEVFGELMPLYRKALEHGAAEPFLRGRPVAPALRATASPRTPYSSHEQRKSR